MAADTNQPGVRSQVGEHAMPAQGAVADTGGKSGDSLSMHADVPVWCDCCTCEAEPYWLEAMGNPDEDAVQEPISTGADFQG